MAEPKIDYQGEIAGGFAILRPVTSCSTRLRLNIPEDIRESLPEHYIWMPWRRSVPIERQQFVQYYGYVFIRQHPGVGYLWFSYCTNAMNIFVKSIFALRNIKWLLDNKSAIRLPERKSPAKPDRPKHFAEPFDKIQAAPARLL